MVDQVGSITYEVEANTSGLLKSERDVATSTNNMTQSFNRTDKAVEGFNAEMGKVPAAVRAANRQIQQTTRSMGAMNGVTQQLGFQLQDIAVQLQAGTSAFTVLGQQGSQVASIFGPGGAVIGAIIAVASALGGVFAASAVEAGEEVEKLESNVDDLIDRIGELTEAQKAYLQVRLGARIGELRSQLVELQNEASSLKATLDSPIQDDNFLKDTSDSLLEVNANIDLVTQQIDEYQRAITGARENNDEWNESNDRSVDRLDTLVERLQAEAALVGQSARAKAIYTAVTQGATQAQLDDINAAFDRIEAYEREQEAIRDIAKARREAEAQQTQDERVIEQARQALLSEEQQINESYQRRNEAILRATQEGSQERLDAQRNSDELRLQQLEELNQREIEANQRKLEELAEQERLAAEQRRERELEEIQQRFEIDEQTAERLLELQQSAENAAEGIRSSFTNALLDVGDQFADTFARAIVQGEDLGQALKQVAQGFLQEIISSLLKVGAQILINQAIGQTAQAAQAATAAVTGAAIASAYAPAAALVSLATSGANAGPALAGIAATTAATQTLAAVPGLQTGGAIGSGVLRRVNENGPELFTDGARQFLLPDRNGQVVSNSEASRMGGAVAPINLNFSITNESRNAGFEVQSVDQEGTEVTINAIVQDIRTFNGPVSRALRETTNVTPRATS